MDLNEKKTYITRSAEETGALGEQLAAAIDAAGMKTSFVALYGDLGAGKTAFVRGFTRRFAPEAAVRSPTYTIVHEYGRRVMHFDMYRIESEDDLDSIGFWDYLARGHCIAEWCENIPYALPDDFFRVSIEKCEVDTERRITIERIHTR